MNEETNMMEGDILSEEVLVDPASKPTPTESPKKTMPKIDPKIIKSKLSTFRKPKFITIVVAFILLITSFSLLIVLGTKVPQDEIVNPDIVIASPKTTSTENKEQTQIEKDLKTYEEKVNNLNTSINNFPPPRLDLEVSF